MPEPARPTVVIPTLNAADRLPAALNSVRGCPVVVADGGSSDDTRALAEAHRAMVIAAAPGRGPQLIAGAEAAMAAGATWLLFLHADTWLQDGWRTEAEAFMADPANTARAGAFTLKFDSHACQARRVERMVRWRSRDLGLPYGDQGLLMSADFYRALGGFRPLPLMEDVDLVRRVGKRRLVAFDHVAVTAADRYERDGWTFRPLRNIACLGLYLLGVPASTIARLYG